MDHATEAARVANTVTTGGDAGEYLGAMAYAQVHATLALAEQQRIANLIALEKVWRSTAVKSVPVEDGLNFQLTRYDLLDEIATTLGLQPATSTGV